MRDDFVAVNAEIFDQRANGAGFVGDVFGDDDDVVSRRVVNQHDLVAVKDQAARGEDRDFAYAVVFGSRHVGVVLRDLQEVEAYAERHQYDQNDVLDRAQPQLEVLHFLFALVLFATHRTSS